MFTYLVLLFTLVPAIELVVLIEVGGRIGAANTILIIILTGVSGAALARRQGFTVMAAIQEKLNHGQMPTDEMISGALIFMGGILLLTPGFITDIVGFLLLIPLTRTFIKAYLRARFGGELVAPPTSPHPNPPGLADIDVEDAEFRD